MTLQIDDPETPGTRATPAIASTAVCLDCTTHETALESLTAILGVPQAVIRALCSQDVDWTQSQETQGDVLLRILGFSLGDVPQPACVRWFHAARVPRSETFEDGLLPFAAASRVVWTLLNPIGVGLVGAERWERFKVDLLTAGSNAAQRLRRKQTDDEFKGPWAHLLRERAIGGHEAPLHQSYTLCPEIVEEVSREFEERFGSPLVERYQEITGPCIVSFKHAAVPKRTMADALAYVYFSLRGEEVPWWCDTHFSARGEAVPRHQIDGVEWL